MKQKKQSHQRRMNKTGRITSLVILGLFGLCFTFLSYRFVSIAVTGHSHGENLWALALNRQLRQTVIPGNRGGIFDRHGNALARQITTYTAFANLNPAHGSYIDPVDIPHVAKQLSTVLDHTEEDLLNLLSQASEAGRHRVEFGRAGRQLSFLQRQAITDLELSGIHFESYSTRVYPQGVFASHTIGFTTLNEETGFQQGRMGIEQSFNDFLQETPGKSQYLRDHDGWLQPNRDRLILREALDGYNIYLTLDYTLQTFLEAALTEFFDTYNPESLVAIMGDPLSGEILAMGSRSTFDPNLRVIENFNNAVIADAFEPGSTLKIFTYAAAINEGVYQGQQVLQSGSRTLSNGAVINDFRRTWGAITFDEGFYRSSNTAIVDMFNYWMTTETFFEYLKAFGFGQPVGIGLPNEGAGTIPFQGDLTQQISAGFGQGLLTTPIQFFQGITSILNGGELLRPQLISHIYNPNTNETTIKSHREVIGNPITAATAEQVKQLLIGAVENPVGTGGPYALDTPSGGKTGTAQIADETGYIPGAYLYSYIGFAPVDTPKLVMYVAMSQPEYDGRTGHDILSEFYTFVMNRALAYLGATTIPTMNIDEVHTRVNVPSLINLTQEQAIEAVMEAELIPIVIGNRDRVFAQSPNAGALSITGGKVFIQTDQVTELPDFTGWTRSQLNQFAGLASLLVETEGEGFIINQSLEPGTIVTEGEILHVTLSRAPQIRENND